jgi:hypothetical protein
MGKLKKSLKITFIIFIILFLFQGCISFHPSYSKKDELGFYVKHHYACGPIALGKALRHLGENVTDKKISQEIQSNGNLSRKAISLVHYEGVLVTWPSEVRTIIEKYGYKIKTLKSISELKDGDSAIILVKGRSIKREWHWMHYPTDKNIDDFYPNTKIIKIYKITK